MTCSSPSKSGESWTSSVPSSHADCLHMRGMPVKRRIIAMRIMAVTLLAAAIVLIMFCRLCAWSTGRLATIADDHERAVAAWLSTKRDRALAQAKAYNRWLTASGQPTLGVAGTAKPRKYRLALETPDGVMFIFDSIDRGPLPIDTVHRRMCYRGGRAFDGTSLPVGAHRPMR